ncbi:NAD(P)/FAD-dependent oxidoreductase [Marinomonas epiphytica]
MAEFLVLGAGMVGVSSALALQEKGHDVLLVDHQQVGEETSFGNAGIIQAEAAEPYALPRDLPTLYQFAFERTNHVHWSWSGVREMAPALFSYFRHSHITKFKPIAQQYAKLTARATNDHAPLISASQSEHLMSHAGLALLYRDQAEFDIGAARAQSLQQEYQVASRILSGAEYRQEESILTTTPAGVVHFTDSWSCASPGDLTKAYAQLFVERGGRFVRARAEQVEPTYHGWQIATDEGVENAEHLVVCLGPWSPNLLKQFGYQIPMIYKRGYHGHFSCSEPLSRPLLDVQNGALAAPMTSGLRITTGASLVPLNAPMDTRQLEKGERAISQLLPLGQRVNEPQWMGTRPCMPDMLPVVGQAPNHPNMWFHFGHGHQGFTLGPTTAQYLLAAISGEQNEMLATLSPNRLWKRK